MLRDHTTTRLSSLVLLVGVLIMLPILLLTFFAGNVTGQILSDNVDNENDNNNNTVVYDVIIIGAGWSGKKREEKKRKEKNMEY